jgi:hypothetical protein
VVVTDQRAEDGMAMKEDILKQPGKVGNIGEAEEVVTMMKTKTIIKDLHAVVVEIQVAMRAEDGTAMKKGILKQPWKVGNIVAGEEAVIMMKMTITKDLQAVVVAEAVIMTMTITQDLRGVAVEVVTMMKRKTILKDLRAAVDDTMKMMTITRGLQVGAAEVRAVAKAEDGMEMRKVIPKHPGKAGSIAAEEEVAAVIMIAMTITKDRHEVVAEVRAVVKAGDGMAMKKNTPVRPGKVGEIVIDYLNWNFGKGTLKQMFNVPFLFL